MKKVISVLLLLAMVIGCFAGCTPEVKEDAALNAAAEYLYALYKEAKTTTDADYTVVGQVRINDVIYPIEWTTDKPANVTVEAGENGMTTIKITASTEDVNYKLTGTLKNADGLTVSVSFDKIIPAKAAVSGKTIVLAFPKANQFVSVTPSVYTSSSGSTKNQMKMTDNEAEAVSLQIVENSDGTITFVSGEYYLYADGTHATFVKEQSDNTKFVLEAADTDGGYYVKCAYATYSGKAQYLEVYSGNLCSYGMGSDPSIYVFKLQESTVAAGAPNMGGSNTDSGNSGNTGNSGSTDSGNNSGSSNTGNSGSSNTGNSGSSNTGNSGNTGNTGATGMITKPETGKAYKLSMNNGKDLYFMGVISKDTTPWYMKSSENAADAIDVYLEAATGGYRLYFTINGTKTYLVMYKDGTHYSLKLTTEASTVYTWNSEYNTLVAMNEDKECFIGTSGTYTTFSCNTIDKVGSSYVAHLFGAGGTGSSNSGSSSSGSSSSGGSNTGSNSGSNTGSNSGSNTGSNSGSNTGSGSTSTTNGATVTFDFTGLTVSDSNAIDATTAASLFNNEAVVSVAATKVYQGNPDTQYGAFCAGKGTGAGYLKLSNSSTNGQLVLTFNKKVAKVEIVCHDWYTKSDSYPTNSNKVAVNGGEAQFAPYSTDATPGSLIFNLDGSSETVTIDTSNTTASKGGRIFIFKIIVTFTN